ncbi:MAG: hypothetical protein ACHQT8_03090, partial [Chlamydiales bacterium]
SRGLVTINATTYYIDHQDQAEKLRNIFSNILPSLVDGDQYEYRCLTTSIIPLPPPCWEEDWQKRDNSCLLNEDGVIYHREIYPIAIAYLRRLKARSIFEICGGRGDFLELFLSKNSDAVERYQMVDLRDENCVSASEKLKSIQKTSPNLKWKVDQYNIIDDDNLAKIAGDQVDCVIGLGALTHQVIGYRNDALAAFWRILPLIRSKGYLLLSGRTPHWIGAADLEEAGLRVLNTHSPQNPKTQLQVYLAQKP